MSTSNDGDESYLDRCPHGHGLGSHCPSGFCGDGSGTGIVVESDLMRAVMASRRATATAEERAVNDLIAFIEARLAEDEQMAEACSDAFLHGDRIGIEPDKLHPSVRRFTYTWTPARVLREVEAKRQLLKMYREAKVYYDANRSAPAGEAHGLWNAVQLLALAWADHPDYRAEWRPE